MDCPLYWEAVKNQSHPKHKLPLAAAQNNRSRQAESDLQIKETASGKLTTKTVKAVTHVRDIGGAETRSTLEINYEPAAAEAINKVKQNLASKEIEQRLKPEIKRQKMNETILMTRPEPEVFENSTGRGNCNTSKMVTGKPFGITKIGARIRSIITVCVHEVTRILSEPSYQTLMDIDVYAGYISTISLKTPSRALRALLTRGVGTSIRIDNR